MFRFALAVLLAAGTGLEAQSPPSDPSATPWYRSVAFDAFLSGSYDYNLNRPSDRRNVFRTFDFADGWNLDVAEAVLQKPDEDAGEWGFRVDLEAGQSVPQVEAAYGLFRDRHTGNAPGFDIQQAFASYNVPLGRGLHVDFGKFVTHMGYEVIEGYDGWNDNATHSFLFGYAVPFTETGLRLTYLFRERFTAQFHLVQGWDVFRDNNTGKTLGLQLAYTPTHKLALILNGIRGPEQKDNDRDIRAVYELVGTWKLSNVVNLGLNYDWGHEPGCVPEPDSPPVTATWQGVAAYQHTRITSRLALNLRAEWFADGEGARTGIPQTLREVTVTPEFRLEKHVIVRADVRRDWSNEAVFPTPATYRKYQTTLLINLLLVD